MGIPEEELSDGAMLVGHVESEPVLLARVGEQVFAIGATCTHYNGPLGEGLLVGETVRCPWHHACFSLRTGEALTAPAFSPTSCWHVERRSGRIFVREKAVAAQRNASVRSAPLDAPAMVIIGGGAAGFAAAEMLRREGYDGAIAMISADDSAPYDRPNLSKDYLAGNAPEDWLPLGASGFDIPRDIDLRLRTTATAIDPAGRRVTLDDGRSIVFAKLLIATGAEPIRLTIPGSERPHVRTLRSLSDCRAIIAQSGAGGRIAIIGASFIGLEAAAALRQRDLEVHVVAPDRVPMERVLGQSIGAFIHALHEQHGVKFHLGHTATAIDERYVQLDDGTRIDADLVVVGIGVRPHLALAEKTGLAIDGGVLVNEYLETSVPDIFAAGDIARWPDPYSGERLRIEHWVVAERQGQTAARNMLGRRERYTAVPFFWTQHYGISVDYVGHAGTWDKLEQDGDPSAHDVAVRFKKNGRTQAVASIFRGRESLEAEVAMERGHSP